MSNCVTLRGLDGSNPLGFLAALGAFRVLDLQLQNAKPRMHWEIFNGAWRPILTGDRESFNEESIIEGLDSYLSDPPQMELLKEIGNDLTINGKRLAALAAKSLAECNCHRSNEVAFRRIPCDFLASFGCDAITADGTPDSNIDDTALRTMSGAGHQHFVLFMREIVEKTNADHLRSTLFERWTYEDAGRGLNLRWDPADDRRYALRWKNPSNDPNVTVRGANRLAIEALPLFSTAPDGRKLQTTGFTQRWRQGVRWTWPIWTRPVSLDTARSIIQLSDLQPPKMDADESIVTNWRSRLEHLGIAVVLQSQRITTGKFRNFTPAKPL